MMRHAHAALVFIAVTIAFTVLGQLLVKQGTLQVGSCPSKADQAFGFICRAFTNPWVIVGLLCAVIAAGAWTMAVSRSDLSFAYPFMGLAIVLVLALSGMILGEHVPLNRWFGVAIVCIGLWVAARG
jgi:drug/metabolite transporter (DMT)-like permease